MVGDGCQCGVSGGRTSVLYVLHKSWGKRCEMMFLMKKI